MSDVDPNQRAKDEERRLVANAIVRVKNGDTESYREIVERYQRPLFRFLSRYVGHREDEAMELVQQTLVRAFERIDKLEDPMAFKSWLYRIGVNFALNQKRDRAKKPMAAIDDIPEPGVAATAEADLIQQERMERVQGALGELSELQRNVVLLRLEGELGYREIATEVGSTEGAVRVHYHNAVKKLRHLLTPDESSKPRLRPIKASP